MNETELATQRTDPLLEVTAIDTQPLATVHAESEPQPQLLRRGDIDDAQTEVIVAGHICLDIIPSLLGSTIQFTPGRLIEAGKAVLSTGGPVSNTGLALHKLGVKTKLMGKVGDDLFGLAIMQIIQRHGPELAGGMVLAPDEPTSYSIILSAPKLDRTFIHASGCNNTFSVDDVRYDLLETTGIFHFGYPPLMERMYRENGAELAEIFQRAKVTAVTTSLDLTMPDPNSAAGRADWQAILKATLPYVDIFVPSVEELLFMLRRPLFEQMTKKLGHARLLDAVTPDVISDIGKSLLDMGAKMVGLKVGHRGLYLRTAEAERLMQMGRAAPPKLIPWSERELWAPCFETRVVGTTGAGDATIAGFLLGLLRGMSPYATLSAACAVGACSVEAADAISGIQTWPETLLRIAHGWPRLLPEGKKSSPLDMKGFGWRWDEQHEVWVGKGDSQ